MTPPHSSLLHPQRRWTPAHPSAPSPLMTTTTHSCSFVCHDGRHPPGPPPSLPKTTHALLPLTPTTTTTPPSHALPRVQGRPHTHDGQKVNGEVAGSGGQEHWHRHAQIPSPGCPLPTGRGTARVLYDQRASNAHPPTSMLCHHI
jgi:hypothetical protein